MRLSAFAAGVFVGTFVMLSLMYRRVPHVEATTIPRSERGGSRVRFPVRNQGTR